MSIIGVLQWIIEKFSQRNEALLSIDSLVVFGYFTAPQYTLSETFKGGGFPMPTVERSALVPFTAQQMYQLVNDVESYPAFLPWCSGASVLEDEEALRVARVDIGLGPVKQYFVTRNELTDGEEIKLSLVEGPFSQLRGHWLFTAIGESGCRVTFSTEYSFKSALLEKTVGPVFNDICARLVDSFVSRARQVYS